MRHTTHLSWIAKHSMLAALATVIISAPAVHAAVPGITGPTFNLTAAPGYITQPDGGVIYTWGYGCGSAPAGFKPDAIGVSQGANCPAMQLPGPTLIVNQGDTVQVTLTNNLPAAAGNTSMLFPGFNVQASVASIQPQGCTNPAVQGVLTTEATHGCAVTYVFQANTPGTHSYYSGTQGDLQIEMGLYGAIIVLPNTNNTPICTSTQDTQNDLARQTDRNPPNNLVEADFRLAHAAYNNPLACYDREYLFQFSEMDPAIHRQVETQVLADQQHCTQTTGCLTVNTEPYVPSYFLINGRSMPDDMDPNYAVQYPNQPYNGNPHMHPGERALLRIIGTGRWQHPFHEHGNHVRVLARDGNMLTTKDGHLSGPLLFTTTTTPGLAMDGIFEWTGKGLNWDAFGHGYAGDTSACTPDANGYYTHKSDGTSAAAEPNYYEWCGDHNKALESKPFGQVGSGGPVTLPDANILTNGIWYGGSPYLGPDATLRAVGNTPLPPAGTVGNDPHTEAGFAYMWHSHNEREITTNNAFPGGMMMMMLVDPRAFVIDESK